MTKAEYLGDQLMCDKQTNQHNREFLTTYVQIVDFEDGVFVTVISLPPSSSLSLSSLSLRLLLFIPVSLLLLILLLLLVLLLYQYQCYH